MVHRGSPGEGRFLGVEIDVTLQSVNQGSIFHLRTFLLLKEKVVVFIERTLLLVKLLTKIFASVLGFELVSAALAELDTVIFEIDEGTKSLNSVLTHENMGSFPNGESAFRILDFL